MIFDKIAKKKIIVFHISNPGQIDFVVPILNELRKRASNIRYYLASSYLIKKKSPKLGISLHRYFPGDYSKYLFLIDIFMQTEIYARGPRKAKRIFIGHGQPNKWTTWSKDNLSAFDFYFLNGPLERSMFEEILKEHPNIGERIKLIDVGYPKLDDQINGLYDKNSILSNISLNPEYPTVLYTPAWDPGGSLREKGLKIVETILTVENINLIVKLHPASLESFDSVNYEFYTGGINWAKEFDKFRSYPNFHFYTDTLVNPVLFVSDLMVTDFSGVALEFMLQDKPVIYIDCPEFYEKTLVEWGNDPIKSKYDRRFNAGRHAGEIVYDLNEIPFLIVSSLENPDLLSRKRKLMMEEFLYNPGAGSRVAVDEILKLMDKFNE
jgi:CDP-glycerol glycerophosphotransferase (TagB/SpsB family)